MLKALNIPTLITLLRIVIIPVFICIFYLDEKHGHLTASILFVLAAITDWLDGYLARNLSQSTSFGAFLDPVADKLLVVCALIMVVGEMHSWAIVMPAAIIIAREVAMSALREWVAQMGKDIDMSVRSIGKIKTAAQMVALIILIAYQPVYPHIVLQIGLLLLYFAMGLTIFSMLVYLKGIWSDLTLAE